MTKSEPPKPDYEALNQKLLVAIVTLTTTFIMVAFGLYWLLGRS
jgi:hypothetical protein